MDLTYFTTVEVDSLVWTALSAHINGKTFEVTNTTNASLALRIDPDNPATEITLVPFAAYAVRLTTGSFSFTVDEPVVYAQLDAGTGDVRVAESL